MGELGSFRLSVRGEASASPEEVTVRKVKSHRLIFRSGKEMKKMLTEIHFRKVR